MPTLHFTLDPSGIKEGAKAGEISIRGMGAALDDVQRKGGLATEKLGKSIGGVADKFKALRSTVNAFSFLLPVSIGAGVVALYKLITAETEAERAGKYMQNALAGVSDDMRDMGDIADKVTANLEKMSKTTTAISAQIMELALEAKQDEFMGMSLVGLNRYSSALDRTLFKQLQELRKQFDSNTISASEMDAELAKLIERHPEFASIIQQMSDMGFEIEKDRVALIKAKEAVNGFTGSFEDLGDSAMYAGQRIKEALNASLLTGMSSAIENVQFKIDQLGRTDYVQAVFEDIRRSKDVPIENVRFDEASGKFSVAGADEHQIALVNTLAEKYKTLIGAQEQLRASSRRSSGSGESTQIRQQASAIKEIDDAIARLTMTEDDYAAHQQKMKIAEWAENNVPLDKIEQYTRAMEESQRVIKFDEASQALQDFERTYQQAFRGIGGMNKSIIADMNKFRDAVKVAFQSGRMGAAEYYDTLQRIDELQQDQITRMSTDWQAGAVRSLSDYSRTAKDAAQGTERFFGNAFQSMEDSLVDFVRTGKLSFSDMVDSMVADLARLMIQQSITAPLASALGGLFGGGSTASAASSIGSIASGLYGFAQGKIFPANTGLSAYRNSIVTRPTLFGFANGGIFPNRGVMGEAGSEAVLPLERDPRTGNLGLPAGGVSSPNVSIIVNNTMSDAAEVEITQAPSINGGVDLEAMIRRVYREDVNRGGISSYLKSCGVTQRAVGR